MTRPYCRYPKDCNISEEDHSYCWARGIPGHECFGGLTEQHKPKKGMGGNNPNSKIVAILCAGIHDLLDNNTKYSDHVLDVFGERRYVIMDLHGNTLLERVIGVTDGRNDGRSRDRERTYESDGVLADVARSVNDNSLLGADSVVSIPAVQVGAPTLLTHTDILTRLSENKRSEPFEWGDAGNDFEAFAGHEFAERISPYVYVSEEQPGGWFDDDGFHPPVLNFKTLTSRMNVAKKFPVGHVARRLTFGHAKVVAALPDDEAQMLLDAALRGQWSVAALTAAVHELKGGAPRRGRTFTREQVFWILCRYKDALARTVGDMRRARL